MIRLSQIRGMTPEIRQKIQEQGITRTTQLIQVASSRSGRDDLAKKIGVSPNQITTWVNHLDLANLKGVGPGMATLLEATGIDSRKELQHRNAENLYVALKAANDQQHITRAAPTLDQVRHWIDEAGAAPPMG